MIFLRCKQSLFGILPIRKKYDAVQQAADRARQRGSILHPGDLKHQSPVDFRRSSKFARYNRVDLIN